MPETQAAFIRRLHKLGYTVTRIRSCGGHAQFMVNETQQRITIPNNISVRTVRNMIADIRRRRTQRQLPKSLDNQPK
jgi:predicted RNA binding protein YcfA (HicA-like mRNA interferase family)